MPSRWTERRTGEPSHVACLESSSRRTTTRWGSDEAAALHVVAGKSLQERTPKPARGWKHAAPWDFLREVRLMRTRWLRLRCKFPSFHPSPATLASEFPAASSPEQHVSPLPPARHLCMVVLIHRPLRASRSTAVGDESSGTHRAAVNPLSPMFVIPSPATS
jgi:hypothetical protein